MKKHVLPNGAENRPTAGRGKTGGEAVTRQRLTIDCHHWTTAVFKQRVVESLVDLDFCIPAALPDYNPVSLAVVGVCEYDNYTGY